MPLVSLKMFKDHFSYRIQMRITGKFKKTEKISSTACDLRQNAVP